MIHQQGAAGVIASFANAGYTDVELAWVYQITRSSHIFVHPSLLSKAVSALECLGVSKEDAQKRLILMAMKDSLPSDILGQGWVTLDTLMSPEKAHAPVKFDGQRAQETALIFFSSGVSKLSPAEVGAKLNSARY